MGKILLITAMLWAGFAGATYGEKTKKSVHVVSRMDVFYFKIDKELLGAELEIYSEDGVKLIGQKIAHRKVLLDFYYESPGKYVIHLIKGNDRQEFNFIKSTPCPETDELAGVIVVTEGL